MGVCECEHRLCSGVVEWLCAQRCAARASRGGPVAQRNTAWAVSWDTQGEKVRGDDMDVIVIWKLLYSNLL